MIYQISIEGQTIPVPEEIGTSDDLVKQSLLPYFPEVANAMITRVEKDGVVTITVVKRAGSKGGWRDLIGVAESRNPVCVMWEEAREISAVHLSMADTLRREVELESVIEEGRRQRLAEEFALARLKVARAVPSGSVPVGF